MTTKAAKTLATFPNPSRTRDFLIHMDIPEFTCLCPMTGQPDFATLVLDYIPDTKCVELKSLKLYVWSFRDVGAYHEAVNEMVVRTSTRRAPWTLVAGNDKRFARVQILRTLCESLERQL